MAIDQETFNTRLYSLLKTRGYKPVPRNANNERTTPQDAEVFEFTFKKDGEDYGLAWVTIDQASNLKVYYNDEQNLDSLHLTILDTVSQNMITGRQIKYTLKYPQTKITEKVYLNQREFYWGLGLTGKTSQINYLGGELLYKNKKHQAYGLGIGINQDLQPVISGRMYWKIGK